MLLRPSYPTLIFTVCLCLAQAAVASEETQLRLYKSEIKPILQEFCYRCHTGDEAKSGLRIDHLNAASIRSEDVETWQDVLDQINQGEMPPPDEKRPTAAQLNDLTSWIETYLREAADAKLYINDRVITRRLTRYEYANTMHDLLGVNLKFGRDLPPDPPSKDGFQNNGATLEMSPTLIEIYLREARRALNEAIVEDEQPTQFEFEQTRTAIGNFPTRVFAGHQPVNPEFAFDLKEYPRTGDFEIIITARSANPKNEGLPRMKVSMGHVPGIIHVPRGKVGEVNVPEEETTFTFRGRMEDFPQPGPVSFGNSGFKGMIVMLDFVDADGAEIRYKDREYAQRPVKPKKKSKNADTQASKQNAKETHRLPPEFGSRLDIEISSITFRSPTFLAWPPQSHRMLLSLDKRGISEDRYIQLVIRRFMNRAFRREVTDQEVQQMFKFYRTLRAKLTFEQAIRETFASVLVSPHFLYIVERRDPDAKIQRVSSWELASRLSFFLWSTTPDEELLQIAKNEQLDEPDVLREQTIRLLSHPRCEQFINRFVDQWLDLDALDRVAVNPEFFPDFDNAMKDHMRDETRSYFSSILRDDRSALELLDSDWTMVNRSLALHYGLSGPRGEEFERINLTSSGRRGGVLWQGSFLLANSNGEDSHPIKRAVWILDRLLASPPGSPPADAPDLDAESPDMAQLTLMQQLAAHRNKESCANCHRGIDPWGIPLENFDAIGRWRTEIPAHANRPGVPVETLARLPDGSEILDVHQLQAYLLEHRREQFATSLVRRLMTYGLGRSLDLGDRKSIKTLTEKFIQSDYRLKSLIIEFVLSDTFQTK